MPLMCELDGNLLGALETKLKIKYWKNNDIVTTIGEILRKVCSGSNSWCAVFELQWSRMQRLRCIGPDVRKSKVELFQIRSPAQ